MVRTEADLREMVEDQLHESRQNSQLLYLYVPLLS